MLELLDFKFSRSVGAAGVALIMFFCAAEEWAAEFAETKGVKLAPAVPTVAEVGRLLEVAGRGRLLDYVIVRVLYAGSAHCRGYGFPAQVDSRQESGSLRAAATVLRQRIAPFGDGPTAVWRHSLGFSVSICTLRQG